MKKDYKFLIEIDHEKELVSLTCKLKNGGKVKLTMKFNSIEWYQNVNGKIGSHKIEIKFVDEIAKMLDEERKILEDWFKRNI